MKLLGIIRFELAYQVRRVSTWLLFVGVVAFVFAVARGNFLADALREDFFLNSPFVIACVTVFGSLIWLLTGAAVAGEAAARDTRTQMHPLTYTTPVSKAEYLGGRFLAALSVNSVMLLAVTAGILLAVSSPGLRGEVVGPFRPAAYLGAYLFIALPNAFIATAIQFSLAAMSRRPMAAYLGSVFLFLTSWIIAGMLYAPLARPDLGRLVDAIGAINIVSDLSVGWTPIEKRTRLIALESSLLWNRLLWLSIALGALALTHRRFRFVHHTTGNWWSRIRRLRGTPASAPEQDRS